MNAKPKQQSRWRPYDACEECGVEARAACRDEDDCVAAEPCPGRRLTPSGVVAVTLAPHVKPAPAPPHSMGKPIAQHKMIADIIDEMDVVIRGLPETPQTIPPPPCRAPASIIAVPVDDKTRVEVAAVVALDGMRARDRVILAAIDHGVGAWEDLGAVGVNDVVAAIAAQRKGQAAMADSLQRIRDVVAAQPDGLRSALDVIDQVRAILAPPQTVPHGTESEAP